MVVREQGKKTENGDNLKLYLGCAMRDVFGEGVQAEIKHAEHHDYDEQEPDHHVKQDVGFSGRRYESRQMMRRQGMCRCMYCLRHPTLGLRVWAAPSAAWSE